VTDGTYNYGRSDIAYSHGGRGKGQSGLDKLNKCYETCTDVGDGTDEPTRSPKGSSIEKPPCCKGGVSFLKMIYRGNPGELLLPSFEGFSGFKGPVVNPCSNETHTSSHGSKKKGGSRSSGRVVKFVSCNQCFPDGTGAVSKSCDAVSDSFAVKTDTEVCMAAFNNATAALDLNSKFPTNMDLYFLDEDEAKMIATTLHTSCSRPVRYIQLCVACFNVHSIMPLMCNFTFLSCAVDPQSLGCSFGCVRGRQREILCQFVDRRHCQLG
jgi:hypothetical protein